MKVRSRSVVFKVGVEGIRKKKSNYLHTFSRFTDPGNLEVISLTNEKDSIIISLLLVLAPCT